MKTNYEELNETSMEKWERVQQVRSLRPAGNDTKMYKEWLIWLNEVMEDYKSSLQHSEDVYEK